jgi:hypothetical protein
MFNGGFIVIIRQNKIASLTGFEHKAKTRALIESLRRRLVAGSAQIYRNRNSLEF